MTDNLLNKRVISKEYGKGVIKASIYGQDYVAVEFNNFMHGHNCDGYCYKGYGWYCFILSKEEAIEAWKARTFTYKGRVLPSDCAVYIVDSVDSEEWD